VSRAQVTDRAEFSIWQWLRIRVDVSVAHLLRIHDHKLFKKRFRLNVRKYAFSNRVIDNWNLLSATCVNCSTINTFKKHLSSELESEAVKFKVSQL